ncbi:MAG: Transglutaminase-like enzyme predicted cysteine protease, partial [Acidimicrobiales bacterium]|nr:Transglutaminase-like enzyme predicted cysteine protease [Acidimicrobiales bacterium]
ATAASVGLAGLIASTRASFGPWAGAGAGVAAALLAVLGLPWVSVRLAARMVMLVAAAMIVRFGALAGGSTGPGSERVLAWIIVSVVVLVLTDRVATDSHRPLGGAPALPGGQATARAAAVIAFLVLLFALILGPTVQRNFAGSLATGAPPSLARDGGAGALRASSSIDMTQRPQLTDAVVMTVEADRPSFWRGQTYDTWDGQRWHQSVTERYALAPGGTVVSDPNDVAASGTDVLRQRVRIEASYSDVLFAAPSAVQVDARDLVTQHVDGTLRTGDRALGRGATYTVVSRRTPITADRLRTVDGLVRPPAIQSMARAPVATARVRAAAHQVMQGAPTAYDKVVAVERWMAARTTYSIDAPLAPEGQDVVDHFLFESRQGWCEQIASSLVVMLRLGGVPARLATGYVPGDRDPVSGAYVVRERHAHAWAEVWFPSVGWVGFDPTASVPFAGTEPSKPTVRGWLAQHAWVLIVGGVVLLAAARPAVALSRRLARWLRRRGAGRRPSTMQWAAQAAVRLEQIGRRAGRARAPAETATAYGAALAAAGEDARLARVGRVLDDALFAPHGLDEAVKRDVDHVLAELRFAHRRPRTLEHSGAGNRTGHDHARDADP